MASAQEVLKDYKVRKANTIELQGENEHTPRRHFIPV